MRIRTIIKNILPFFVVERYRRVVNIHSPPLNITSEDFERNFNEKAKLLADQRFSCTWEDILPCLNDNTSNTSFDAHYIYHTAWAARILAQTKPTEHVDIGSSLHFIINVSAFVPIKFYDYRPANINLSNLNCKYCDIVSLPFPDGSVESLSCMHVVEHIGLERYGDHFDPQGDLKAIHELQRVVKPTGYLLFVVPLGEQMRIQYNAHRIYTFGYVCNCFDCFSLENFAFVTDDGRFLPDAKLSDVKGQKYGCGCFLFKRLEITNYASYAEKL